MCRFHERGIKSPQVITRRNMSDRNRSRDNIRRVQQPATAAELLVFIEADPSIGPRKKQEWCSAIRSYCKWTEKAPEYVPVDHRAAAREFAGLSFLVCGVSEGRFNNVKSIVIRVFRGNRANLIETRVVRLLPVWARLLDETDDPWLGLQCGRFFRWCSAKGILPCQVIQASADQFALDLEELMPTHRSRKAFVTMCRGWNKAASKRSDLWPPVRLDPVISGVSTGRRGRRLSQATEQTLSGC